MHVFRIRSVAAYAIHTYFQERGYLYVHTPLITCADCEGSDQMFKITTLNMNDLPAIWSYSLTTESDDVYSSYALEDNTSNNTLENYKFPKIYRTNVSSVTLAKESGDGTGKTEVKFGSENGVSFLICYYDSSVSISEPIIRGTFKTEFVDEKPIEPNTISQVNYFYAGYNGNFNNPHYKEFITPKIIKTCIITFVIAGIFTGILGFIWTIDVHAEKTTDTNKKKKENRI